MATMMALAALPLAGLSLGAVEYHRITMIKGQLQSALDTATLAVARTPNGSDQEVDTLGATVLRANLAWNGKPPVFEAVDFTVGDGTVTGTATLHVTPIIAHMVLGDQLRVRADSEASLMGDRLEIALVIDNTYSMLGSYVDKDSWDFVHNGRLAATQAAAIRFVDVLKAAASQTYVGDALKISVVPFASTVNTGMAGNSTWMSANLDMNAQSSIHDDVFMGGSGNRLTLLSRMGLSWGGCVEARPIGYDASDAPPTSASPDSLFVPYFAPDEPWAWSAAPSTNDYLPDADIYAGWKINMADTAKYNTSTWSFFGRMRWNEVPGPEYDCANLAPVLRLSTNYDAVKARISSMDAVGHTNLAMGLMWGWHTLSPHAPYADGSAYGSGPQKIVVMMTDGNNHIQKNSTDIQANSAYSGTGYLINGMTRLGITDGTPAERTAKLDERMLEVCRNMKERNITLYMVRVSVATSNSTLETCATGPHTYFDINDADLESAFVKIAESIVNPRLIR